MGFEGLSNHIVSETIITPDDWSSNDIYRGAVFNLAHSLEQMLWRRPQNHFEETEGLYLVGGELTQEAAFQPYLRVVG